jgi:hypothetical protein
MHQLGLWILFAALAAQTVITSELTTDIVEYFHTDNSMMALFMITYLVIYMSGISETVTY